MPRVIGVSQILRKEYRELDFAGKWADTFGRPGDPFTMLVYGHPKNGKTSFMMQFAKYLTRFGKVFYNSIEEGDSKSIQDAMIRAQMDQIPEGKFMLGTGYYYRDLFEYLKGTNRGKFIILDSRDYMNLTSHQWKNLITKFPHKCFVVICWEQAGKPAGKFAKDIEYMVDIVAHVANYKAKVRGRFGGGKDFVIWEEGIKKGRASAQASLF